MNLKPKYEITFKEIKRGFNVQHLYCVNGEEFPSATTVLSLLDDGKSGALMGWAKKISIQNMVDALKTHLNQNITITEETLDWLAQEAKREPERLKEMAANIGSQCHNSIDAFIKNELDYEKYLIDDEAKNAFNSFISWIKKQDIEFVLGDTPVVSTEYKVGGRLDAIGKLKGNNKLILFDWKTSNSIRNSYAYQCGIYLLCFQETFGKKIDYAYIVRFGKEQKENIEIKEIDIKKALAAAKALLKLYNLNKENLFKEVKR